jgi:hypothetical protein
MPENAAFDHGPVTVDDLRNRVDAMYAAHMDTYHATRILHDAYMTVEDYDTDRYNLVEDAIRMVAAYRDAVTRPAWRRAFVAWATTTGVPIPDDMRDGAESESE